MRAERPCFGRTTLDTADEIFWEISYIWPIIIEFGQEKYSIKA